MAPSRSPMSVAYRAGDVAKRLDHGWIDTKHVLLAMFDEPSPATEALEELGVTRDLAEETRRRAGRGGPGSGRGGHRPRGRPGDGPGPGRRSLRLGPRKPLRRRGWRPAPSAAWPAAPPPGPGWRPGAPRGGAGRPGPRRGGGPATGPRTGPPAGGRRPRGSRRRPGGRAGRTTTRRPRRRRTPGRRRAARA